MNPNLDNAIFYKDATELARLIRTKELSSREVVQAHLDRINIVNPKVNAIVTLMSDDALRSADIADKAIANRDELGPLHGVPFTIKDTMDTAGVPSQRGSLLFAGHIPDKDATAVARFKAAGGISLAKTNIPEFAGWTESDNRLTGRTNNPWNLERTAGGSTGGEAAMIASGMSPIGIGSDVAISVRGPAAFNGIAALKATHGRVPYTGHFPTAMSKYWHVGPMARSIADVALGYSILKGPDGIDPYAVHAKDAEPASARFAGRRIRVGWVSDQAFGPVDTEITAAVAAAAMRLKDLGCDVEEVVLPFMEKDWLSPFFTLWYGEMIPFAQKFATGRESELHAVLSGLIATPLPSLLEFVDAQAKVEELKSAFAGYFQKYDVLLCPVNPFTAPRHAQDEVLVNGVPVSAYHVMTATSPFNMTGLPALSVPFAFSSEQLPISIQLVSRWLDEATILRLGALLERQGGLQNRRPPI
ncbi:amidase [Undibacterium sp. TJN25]|uniref:amidase n=1 Tax=Undibacterium sp. TJN25 TaxID=3413056 RepID=UPI003BF25059